MFDLTKALTNKDEKENSVTTGITDCTLFYQSQQCLDLVNEVFRFEGWDAPEYVKTKLGLTKLTEQHVNQLVILELIESNNVVEDAKSFAANYPPIKGWL